MIPYKERLEARENSLRASYMARRVGMKVCNKGGGGAKADEVSNFTRLKAIGGKATSNFSAEKLQIMM